jgi:RNA polymerase sigma factor (sigma-70 family)
MPSKREPDFAEVAVDRLIVESFANEASAYFKSNEDLAHDELFDRYRSKLRWHLNHSLSRRQKQVMKLYLMGKKQREIGEILGIKQQVVSIYKRRAIKKLRNILLD